MKKEKIIILTSVGTIDDAVRVRTYELLKMEIAERYPGWLVLSAYTSRFLLKKKNTENFIYSLQDIQNTRNLKESEVIVFPTHLFFGEEYKSLQEDAEKILSFCDSMIIGKPFLEEENIYWMAEFLQNNISLREGEALLCVGHGSKRREGSSYEKINQILEEYEIIDGKVRMVGVLKGDMQIDVISQKLKKKGIYRIVLMPFLLVAGGHASKDIFGTNKISWESRLLDIGYSINKIEKGLLEYPQIRQQYIKTLEQLIKRGN